MIPKIGDRIIYTPNERYGGVRSWNGIRGYIDDVGDVDPDYGTDVRIVVDREFHRKVATTSFRTYTCRLKHEKAEILWEV